MSALARLAALASGRASSRLRPVLPARFEPGGAGGEDFAERIDEVPAAPAAPPAPAAQRGFETPTPEADPPARPESPEARPARVPISGERVPAPKTPPAPLIDPPEKVRVRPDSAPPQPRIPAADRAAPPLPADPGSQPEPPPRSDVAHVSDQPRVQAAPPPLLPQETAPAGPFEPAFAGRLAERRGLAPTAGAAAEETPVQAPEITIHIGRIELREAAAPARAQPRRERRAPQIAPLGDYLKGGSG